MYSGLVCPKFPLMDWTYLAPAIFVYSQLFVCIAALCVPSPPLGLDVLGASYLCIAQLCV